ncbi:hypothetical protein AVEN_160275-1 [Araneus ventricosus]|uniref:Uncharacterized protein n=1 Tax=Araneus ventricosus TaxID=182803 RepID=A0A4Y2QKT1_ARAVE|nr:hypothetical protein AVEN_160274-1 [Araneus ventricosus]GBN63903.1 hypothetical protein AVEN_160275-1 [Araneus ventricosus]
MSYSDTNECNERRLTLSDMKHFNQKCLDKLVDMERSKNRIVKDFIDQLHLPLIVPAHMDPTELQDVLMRMKRRIEINFIEFKKLVVAHGECVQELCALITAYDCLSKVKWRILVKQCEKLKPSLEERLSEFLSATNQAEEVLFL